MVSFGIVIFQVDTEFPFGILFDLILKLFMYIEVHPKS